MKVGIAGAGMIVNDFLSFVNEIDDIELIAIYSRSNKNNSIDQLCQEHDIKKKYFNYDEMLEDPEVEVVYVALPNHLHFEFCKKALLQNKHVICEKPFTSNSSELEELCEIAKESHLMLFEAITNQYLPNYLEIKKHLNQLGNIKIVECNFSQYSSRYDAFKEGAILPVFDKNMSGGALMDLNVYNIYFAVGLFGKPLMVKYYANIEREIDVSGILIMDYGSFKCVCIGAKDCSAPISTNIQGDKGCIHLDTTTSQCTEFEIVFNNKTKESFDLNEDKHRMYHEFVAFSQLFMKKDYETVYKNLEQSIIVMDILTEARKSAGIKFLCDE